MNRLSFRSFSFQAVFRSKYVPVCKMKTTASPKRSRLFRNYPFFFFFFFSSSSMGGFVAGFDAPILMKNQTRLINDSGNFQFSRENTPNWECFFYLFIFTAATSACLRGRVAFGETACFSRPL